jgi:hypothetical protein
MAQFTIYSSGDASAPVLTGTSGSLLAVFDACLVDGYGAKSAAGWTRGKPHTGSVGWYVQGTDSSGFAMAVFDNALGAGAAGSAREARIVGYESITDIAANLITGSGQFPTFAQLGIGSGSVICRKSATIDSTARPWIIFADSRTMYTFIQAGDGANIYQAFCFGDFYSMKTGSIDLYRCMISGRPNEATITTTADKLDNLSVLNTAVTGHFSARSYSAVAGSITIGKHGDGTKGSTSQLNGTTQYLNAADSGVYISNIWVVENLNSTIRGRMRGFYQLCHAVSNFSDGQVLTGNADFTGKNFYIVKNSANSGIYCIETSNTLETNS